MLLFPVDKLLRGAGGLGSIGTCEGEFLLGVLGTRVVTWALKRPRTGFSFPFLSQLQTRKTWSKGLFQLVAKNNADTLRPCKPGQDHLSQKPWGSGAGEETHAESEITCPVAHT